MPSLIDVKPIGAFIEYTLKPLIDYSHELLERLEVHGLSGKYILKHAVILYIVDKVFTFLTSITVTGLICYTALHFLHTAK